MIYKHISLLFTFLFVICGFKLFSVEEIDLTDKQMKTLQIIHQLSWSAQKIYTFNDKIALYEEQTVLSSDGMDLSKFKEDPTGDLYKIVKELRDTIFDIKLSEDEKEKLKEFLEDEKTIAFIQNANLFKGVVRPKKIEGDPYAELAVLGAKIIANIGEGVSNYMIIRKKLELQLKTKLWEEEKRNRERLHKSMQNFDERIKNAIVSILPKDKGLRTTLAHIEELVDAVKKANFNESL